MTSIVSAILFFLPATYGLTVFSLWIAQNRLYDGLLFQKPVYILATWWLIGGVLAKITTLILPNAEIAPAVIGGPFFVFGTWTLHQALIERAQSKRKWDIAVLSLSTVLFVALLLLNV